MKIKIAAAGLGSLLVLVVTAMLVAHSPWFQGFVKDKVIATVEESTGGRAEMGSFRFDPWHLTVRITDFTLHGTEAGDIAPLAHINLLELRMKLFAGLKQAVDLAYLGITDPRVNLIVNADGTTNIPAPRMKKQPSQTSGLETVVDLAVGEFRIDNGLLVYSQKASAFSARGNDLRALLNFNSFNHSYAGRLMINPLVLSSGSGSPLNVTLNLPLLIETDAVSISGGRLSTALSQISINAGLRDLNSPKITARVNANLSLSDVGIKDSNQFLVADMGGDYDDKTGAIEIQAAHATLGQSDFEASGTLRAARSESVQFRGKLALDELSHLLPLGDTKLSGIMQVQGHAKLDAQKNYLVDGTLNSQRLGLRSGTTNLSDIRVASPFHADPYLISLDGLKLNALGGEATGKIFVERLRQLSAEAHLSNISLGALAGLFESHPLAYAGVFGGVVMAQSDLKAKGTDGLTAQVRLAIAPRTRGGIPVSGEIDGRYNGASGILALEKSYVTLPHSRLDVSGDINKQLNATLVSKDFNDFLPLAPTLPVTLQGGTARLDAQTHGNLSAPQVNAHAAMDHFAVHGATFAQAALDLSASSSRVAVQNGLLTSADLNASFDGSIGLQRWQPMPKSPLLARITIPNGQLATILALAGQQDMDASGKVNAVVSISGTYGDPLGNANLQVVNGVAYGQAFDKVQGEVDLVHQLITLTALEVDAAGGRLTAHGTYQHPGDSFQTGHAEFHVDSSDIQLANVQPLQKQSPGAAGILKLVADGAGDIRNGEFQISNISSDLSARGLKLRNQAAGDLVAQARTSNGTVVYKLNSDFAGSVIQVDGSTSLTKDHATKTVASIQNLQVEKALMLAGETGVPVKGVLSLNGTVSGTMARPQASVQMMLSKAVVYSEPLNELSAKLEYTPTLIDIPTLRLDAPAGTLTAAGNFAHKQGDFSRGQVELHVNGSDLDLSKIERLAQLERGVAGGLKLNIDIAGRLQDVKGQPPLLLTNANAELDAHSLRANGKDFGDLHATAKTQQHLVQYQLNSNLAQGEWKVSGQTELSKDYLTHAKFTFGKVRWANIAPFVPSDNPAKSAFDALVDGSVSVDGPVLNVDGLTGRLQLDKLMFETAPRSLTGTVGRKIHLETDAPAILTLNHSVIHVEHLKIQDAKSYLQASGGLSLKDANNGLALRLEGNADLSVLQNADRDFYSAGNALLDTTIHGSLEKPLVNGRVELKNASINYVAVSNGLSNGNGVILLNGTNATIQSLTGETGGGKISLTGFAGFTPTDIDFNLRATATKVRTRYSGASITSSADIGLAGNTNRSALSGVITIQRIAYSSSSDVGSFLSQASVPPSTPAAPSPFLSGMRLDLRIVTSPTLRVVSTYTDKLSLTSNLTVTGTAQNPGIIGRINVTNGELVFFGNTYNVNTGSINFYDTNAIRPVLDLSLETLTQGVDVTLGVTGQVSNLKLSYRSDPPLTFEQIVQLLATNTTPSDPTIAAHQPTPPQQSASQMGESAVLGQAVANPLASRVQRVFGLTQFKIDPSLSGSNGQPSARVTLQQKIANNLTFTYITDVTQTNSEIVRVTFDLTPKVSAVALRDYNGNVSLEFFYKFKVR